MEEYPCRNHDSQRRRTADGVYMLYNGEVSVERSGTEIGTSRDGALIGEMSFIKEGIRRHQHQLFQPNLANAYFGQSGIESLLRRNPSIDVALNHVFSVDLAKKLETS